MIFAYKGIIPRIDPSVFVAANACVIGDVEIGENSSVWFNVLVRGDVNYIRIGRGSNIQDSSVVHVTSDTHPTFIGNNVSVGHSVTLHGCKVQDDCLIGIGSILLDGVDVGSSSLVAAGSLLAPGTKIPSNSLVMGRPAKVKRMLTEAEKANMHSIAERYIQYREDYRVNVQRIG